MAGTKPCRLGSRSSYSLGVHSDFTEQDAAGAESRLCRRATPPSLHQTPLVLGVYAQTGGGCRAAGRSDLCPNTPQSPNGALSPADPPTGPPEGSRAGGTRPSSWLPRPSPHDWCPCSEAKAWAACSTVTTQRPHPQRRLALGRARWGHIPLVELALDRGRPEQDPTDRSPQGSRGPPLCARWAFVAKRSRVGTLPTWEPSLKEEQSGGGVLPGVFLLNGYSLLLFTPHPAARWIHAVTPVPGQDALRNNSPGDGRGILTWPPREGELLGWSWAGLLAPVSHPPSPPGPGSWRVSPCPSPWAQNFPWSRASPAALPGSTSPPQRGSPSAGGQHG